MRAITKQQPEQGFTLVDNAQPATLGANDVRIRVLKAGICGSDLHIVDWDEWSASRIKPPMVFGHEFCGEIAEVGAAVSGLAVGDYVTAEMHLACGTCVTCQAKLPHICENLKIAGVDRDGCFAESLVLPAEQVVKLPPGIPKEVAACMDAIGNAVHCASKVPIEGKRVLVTGCGPIGLFAVAAARAMGAKAVYASDIQPYRLKLAEKVKADAVYNALEVDVLKAVMQTTHNEGIDVVLEMSGNARAIESGLEALRPGGAMVILGIPARPVPIDIPKHILFKETRIIGVTGRQMFETWDLMLDLMTSGKLDVTPLITHEFPFAQFEEAVALMQSGETGKVLISLS